MNRAEKIATTALLVGAVFGMYRYGVSERYVAIDNGLAVTRARVEKPLIEPVREYFALRVRATYGPLRNEEATLKRALSWLDPSAREQLRKRLVASARAISGKAPAQPDLLYEAGADRLVWTNIAPLNDQAPLKLKVEDSNAGGPTSVDYRVRSARITVGAGQQIILRRARSGCRVLEGPYVVVRAEQHWVIHRLPSDRMCSGDEYRDALRQSWKSLPPRAHRPIGDGNPSDVTFPSWARGNLQLVEPFSWQPSGPSDTSARLTVDHQRFGHVTAWRAPVGHAIGSKLSFTFPASVRLARIKLANGVSGASWNHRYRDNGRIALATVRTDHGTFYLLMPDRPEFYELRCDFGPTRYFTLTVNSIYPAHTNAAGMLPDLSLSKVFAGSDAEALGRSNVALSDIQFWGVRAAPGDPGPSSTRVPATRPRNMEDHSYRALCPAQGQQEEERSVVGEDGSSISIALSEEEWAALSPDADEPSGSAGARSGR
jgi:hypothetical protein